MAASKKTIIPIHTLQLPALRFENRSEFLDIRQRIIVEPVLRNKELFLHNNCDATLFHKDSNEPGFGTPLIHTVVMNGIFSLRAYGEKATKTLESWREWIGAEHSSLLQSVVCCSEDFVPEKLSKPMVYESDNYIPFSKCASIGDYFIDAEKPEADYKSMLQSRLTGNLRTFLKNADFDDQGMDTMFDLVNYPSKAVEFTALKRKGEPVWKKSFCLRVETNLLLPFYFSLGQNAAYGCGLFKRVL